MKRGTPHHPKTYKLARLLKVQQYSAIGLLESLWHWTAKYAIQGDVGRFSDQEIADGCFWDKEPKKLVQALLSAGWLDEDLTHRLLVHDWQEHADQSVQKTIRNRGLVFRNVSGKFQKSMADRAEKVSPSQSQSQSQSQSLSQSQEEERGSAAFSASEAKLPEILDTPHFREVWKAWIKHRIEIRKKLTPTSVSRQLKELESWGEQRAIAAIEHTMAKGWQGIREPDHKGYSYGTTPGVGPGQRHRPDNYDQPGSL